VFRRRQVKTQSQLMRDELSEGFGHIWQAAAHAAAGLGETVGPKWDSAKGHLPPRTRTMRDAATYGWDSTLAAFAPLMDAARSGAVTATKKANKARKKAMKKESGMSRKRATILVGLLTAGAAAGAAGALIARRRNRAKWEEYEAQGIKAVRSTVDKGAQKVSGWADAARESTETPNIFAEQAKQTSGSMAGRTGDAMEPGKTHSISKNTRS
jgi:hypothetical protein